MRIWRVKLKTKKQKMRGGRLETSFFFFFFFRFFALKMMAVLVVVVMVVVGNENEKNGEKEEEEKEKKIFDLIFQTSGPRLFHIDLVLPPLSVSI